MKKYLDLFINFLYVFILSISFNLIVFKSISLLTIIYILLTSIGVSSLVKLISDIFKRDSIKKIINIVFLGFINILFIAQLVHFYFYNCFFSFYSLTKSGQILDFISQIMKIIYTNIFSVSIFIILLTLFIIITVTIKYTREKSKILLEIVLVVITSVTFILCINIDKKDIYSSYNLVNNINNNTMNFKKFGVIPGEIIDFKRYFKQVEPRINKEYSNSIKKEYNKKDYNVTDFNFNLKTNDKSIKELNNYFKNTEPTNKNKYTGIFKDKNLVFITAESFDFNIIDKDLTPTLYKLKEEGLFFNNFYTPIYYASTSDGEFINLTGLLPKEGIWSFLESKNNYYPYSYANIFEKDNYKTYSYHNGEYNFYDRYQVMPKFGFSTFKACGKDLKINCNLWPQSDAEMINTTFNDYKNDEKFVSYYMSISGHLSHNFKNNDMAIKHKDKVEKLKYSDTVKSYISANIDLDKAVEGLLKNLEKENKLDDTVIVLVPDHFPYGLTKNEMKEIQSIKNEYDIHKTGLIIYNSQTKGENIDKLSSSIDILPTLLNMYGKEYDSRIIIGKDIMSSSKNIVVFNDQSFLTEHGYYNAKTNEYIGKKSENKLEDLIKEVNNKYNASNIIIDKNYYKLLFKKQ